MKIGINEQYQIKQIREITDGTLTVIELDETAEMYPFKNFSDIRIKSYCYKADNGSVSIYPYVDLKEIEKQEQSAYLLDLDFRTTLLELGV